MESVVACYSQNKRAWTALPADHPSIVPITPCSTSSAANPHLHDNRRDCSLRGGSIERQVNLFFKQVFERLFGVYRFNFGRDNSLDLCTKALEIKKEPIQWGNPLKLIPIVYNSGIISSPQVVDFSFSSYKDLRGLQERSTLLFASILLY